MGKHLVQKENKEKKFSFPKKEKKTKSPVENDIKEARGKSFLSIPKGLGSGRGFLVLSALLLAVMPFCFFEAWIVKLLYGIILLIAASELIWDFLDNIRLENYFAYQNVVFLSILLAYVIGLDFEAVLLAVLYRIIKLVLSAAEENSWDQLKDFRKIIPDTANVETVEGVLKIQPDMVNVGDIVQVEPGERIPLDGVIVEGISTIDTSAVSGQSTAWAVAEGHRVYSGCRNITSKIRVKVVKPFEQSTAKNIVKLANSATEYNSRQEKSVLGIKKYFPLAVLLAAVVFCISMSVLNGNWIENAKRAVILLSAALSSAGLATVSLVYIKSIGVSSTNGIFVKGSDCIEAMARAETMVFDKTGIITEGRYVITDVFPNKVSEQQLLSMAATAEIFSRHPIAAVLREAAGPLEIDYRSLQIEEIPGRGISAFIAEKQVYVGNAALLQEHGIKCAIPTRSGAAIHVAVDYKYWGHIIISDRIRRGAFDSLENLRANGVRKLVLLTGDVLSVAKPLASKLNFDMLRAELKPSEKASAVDFLMANRGDSTTLAFVGDGNSDEHIMSRVDVGIALGALGSDAALSFADVLIMDRDIKKLPAAIRMSRRSYLIALENILAWLLVNALVITLGIIGVLPALIAIIIEFILVIALVINSSRVK